MNQNLTREQTRILEGQLAPSVTHVAEPEALYELDNLPEGHLVKAGMSPRIGLLVHELPFTLTIIAGSSDGDTIYRYDTRSEPLTRAVLTQTNIDPGDPKHSKYAGMLREYAFACRRAKANSPADLAGVMEG